MPFPAELAALVATFAANEADYTAPDFKEAQVRQQFLDPLFAALGWDVANTAGYAEAYKEVIHEDALKIGGETKAPDYSFRIGGQRKFFVEAKKPSVLIKDHPEPAYQLRRYSWSAKLPLGILTDFQEFAVYDTRVKPAPTDKASAARLFYCRYDELEKHWDFIAGTFSKEAILKGSFDKYAATTKGKRGTATVDDAFLEEIENWRDLLARNLALRNPALDTRGLNFAVQRTIDRIVFLRIAEDRGNEPFGQLQALTAGPKIYPRLVEIFEKADYRYNSGLFHFAKDPDCAETPDTLTPGLAIDDAVLKNILGSLYYPQSPYAFGVLPAYILGHVYEQFLGKVIRLTDGHQAKVEEKPEVRKAGGVYYTPQYIVDYIVQKTLDPLLADQTPKQIETLAVLDPACGSGTFLLGAYDHLLKWYLAHYSANAPEKWAKQGRLYETAPNAAKVERVVPNALSEKPPARSWQLTTTERKRILLAHIHGVDIDAAAVEVTKLSLLLKVLEGERREFQGKTKEMSAVLPDLSRNIKCGNSLIGHDFYAQPDLPTLDAEAKYKLNTFEWKDGFPEVIKRGGFDAVIGNPPYLGGREWKEENGRQYDYFCSLYEVAEVQFDIYALFLEKGLKLLRPDCYLGYITPNTWFNNKTCLKLRSFLLAKSRILAIADYSRENVFKDAIVLPAVTIMQRGAPANEHEVEVYKPEKQEPKIVHSVKQSVWAQDTLKIINIDLSEADASLRDLIVQRGAPLSDFATVKFGIKIYETGRGTPPQKATDAENHVFESDKQIDSTYRPYLEGKDVDPYLTKWKSRWLKYGPNLAAPRDPALFEGERLVFRRIVGERLIGTLLEKNYVTSQLLQIVKPHSGVSAKFLLGVLNSKLTAFIFRKTYNRTEKTFPEIRVYELETLPIPQANEGSDFTRTKQKLEAAVQGMLNIRAAQAAAQSPHEKDALAKQIIATDRQIDALVYQLYGLTPEEIALVEGAG